MAFSATLLTSINNKFFYWGSIGPNIYLDFPSVSTTTGRLVFLVMKVQGTTPSSVTGLGTTWTLISMHTVSIYYLAVYVAATTTTSGSIHVVFGNDLTNIYAQIIEVADSSLTVDTVVQIVTQYTTGTKVSTVTALATLATFASATNLALGFLVGTPAGSPGAYSPGSGFTTISTTSSSVPQVQLFTEYKVGDRTVDATFSFENGTYEYVMVGLEIATRTPVTYTGTVSGAIGGVAGTLFRRTNIPLAGTPVFSGVANRGGQPVRLTGTMGTLSGALASIKARTISIGGTMGNMSGSLVRKTFKVLDGSPLLAKVLNKRGQPVRLTGVITGSGVFLPSRVLFKSITGILNTMHGTVIGDRLRFRYAIMQAGRIIIKFTKGGNAE